MGFNLLSKIDKLNVASVDHPNSHDATDPEKGRPASSPKDEETISVNAQTGVKAVQAATIVWTKWHLIGAYVMWVGSCEEQIDLALTQVTEFGGFTFLLLCRKSLFVQ